jgi:Spy/CpxP family protein refolding chaperone
VSPWKVILATLVIFIAGLGTGVLLDKRLGTLPPPPVSPALPAQRLELMGRMNRQLNLTPPQREIIEQIFHESRERIRKLRETVEPKVKEETRLVRERIRQVLTPEQLRKFDQLMDQRSRWRGPEGARKGWRTREGAHEPPPADEGLPNPPPQRGPPDQ